MIARLLEIKWRNFSEDEIAKHLELFHTPNFTIDDLNKYFPKNK